MKRDFLTKANFLSHAVFAIAAAILIGGCSASQEIVIPPVDELFQRAMEKFNDESYLEAIEDFKMVTIQYPGSSFAADAQMHLAESRFLREEFVLAAAEYDILIRTNISSSFVPRARYQKALSYYRLSPKSQLDQKYSYLAIDEFQSFVEYFPTDTLVKGAELIIVELHTKLAKKEFENALLYYRMSLYKAAAAYYQIVMDRYHDTEFADDAMIGKARSQFARKEYAEAQQTIGLFFDKYPASTSIDEAASLNREIEEKLPEKKNRKAE